MLRDRPYRMLFSVGVLLCAAGTLHWVLHSARLLPDYRPVFHVTAQVQGFLTCMIAGFLMTMLPRRLSAAPPRNWQVMAVATASVAATFLAWQRAWPATQLVWSAGVVVLLGFVLSRMANPGEGRRPPNGFVWIPAGLALGLVGALMTVLERWLPGGWISWHQLGQDLVLQAFPLALVFGAGAIVFPLMTSGEGPPDGFARADRLALTAHALAALLLLSSFWLAIAISLRAGLLVRAAVATGVMLGTARLWRAPARPGWNARLIYLCGWAVPVGLLLAAIWTQQQRAGLHVTFIGGFALLALAVAAQVSFGHGGRREEILGHPVMVPVLAVGALVAIGARAAMEFDPQGYFSWMQLAGLAWLVVLALWTTWALPALRATPRDPS